MPQYLLSIHQPDGASPDAETQARITADLHRFNEELRESGSWVFTGGLHAPGTATVVRADGMITDGPYVEGKEFIGGIWVITAPRGGRVHHCCGDRVGYRRRLFRAERHPVRAAHVGQHDGRRTRPSSQSLTRCADSQTAGLDPAMT